ncbi:hypothetical protein DR864_21235 [Runella rosea]|uniref:Nucleotidyltransferase domain-containing protein n=1 Tax=Runella rosea TaxID=2259595 RepID=A0A344TN71_9BACT|nr:hypothetical protein [Runella rosea]AXE20092.1 hypothetical protein DR864_21235 [Runella rosea]
MQLQFDANGNLIPPQIFPLTLPLLEEHFVNKIGGEKRGKLFRHYTRYLNDIRDVLSNDFVQWIGGSFISTKSQPNDIDIVNLIKFDDNTELLIEKLLPFFLIGGAKDNYCIDGHLLAIYSENDERYQSITEPVRRYWKDWLGKDRQDNARGFVELTVTLKNDRT